MRRLTLIVASMILTAGPALGFPQEPQKEKAKETLRCTLTDKKMEKCCCEKREGKLYCTLAKKSMEKCCCESLEGTKAKKP